MIRFSLKVLAFGAACASGGAVANIAHDPAYFDDGLYSAAFAQDAHRWHLQPLAGDVVDVIDHACINQRRLPRGVWLVSRDASDHLQLVAPSTTELPSGFPEQLRLVACGSGEDRGTLGVPAIVLAWLADNSNAVMIDE